MSIICFAIKVTWGLIIVFFYYRVNEGGLSEFHANNGRRDSELSELQRGLRSVSASDGRLCYTGGHMPGFNFLNPTVLVLTELEVGLS